MEDDEVEASSALAVLEGNTEAATAAATAGEGCGDVEDVEER